MSVKNHKAQKYSSRRRAELMENFLEAYEKALGVVTPAAKAAGIHRATVYRWRADYPEFDEACKEIEGVALDFVETKMFDAISKGTEGSAALTIFYLKTKGKNRGYVEKQQLDVNADVKGVTVNVTSPETAQVLQDIMDKEQ